jgi:hypothetical protein
VKEVQCLELRVKTLLAEAEIPTEILTLTVPASLTRALDSVSQECLVEILERGLRALKVERALGKLNRLDLLAEL